MSKTNLFKLMFVQNGFVVMSMSMFLYNKFCFYVFLKSKQDRLTIEPRREKSVFFAYAKTRAQISFAVTAKLISALFSLHG